MSKQPPAQNRATDTLPVPKEPRWLGWLPAWNPYSMLTIVFVLSLIVAPMIHYPFDVESCWLPWSQASNGMYPWRIYLERGDCNYPPFVLYLLTLQEAIRRLIGAPEIGVTSFCLTKIPNIIAHVGGALAGYMILRKSEGETYARRFALLYSLSLPLFVNAALWGQADALLSLAMVVAVALLMAGRPVRAGAAIGWALVIKLQAIVIVPVLLLYTYRKYGWQSLLRGMAAGFAVMAVIALPFVVMGAGKQMLAAYVDAAGYYPQRSLNTFNLWSLCNYVDQYILHVSDKVVNEDSRIAFWKITYRQLSIGLFAIALAWILRCVWKRPDGRTMAWAAALSVLSFTTLCTQMHERYPVPGVALLALVAPDSLFALFYCVLFSGVSAWNEWVVLLPNYLQYNTVPDWIKQTGDSWGWCLIYLSAASIALLTAGLSYLGIATYPSRSERRRQRRERKISNDS